MYNCTISNINCINYTIYCSYPGGTSGKKPTVQCRRREMWVWLLIQEDTLEEGMATHSSILVWRIPWTEKPSRLQSIGSQSQAQMKWLNTHGIYNIYYIIFIMSIKRTNIDILTQRDGMGREEGGGFRMGNTCIPVADSFWYLAKLIQLCKV